MTTVESHENISCYLVNKQKLFCTRASIHGATTPVGLADACLQDLLLGLSLSCSNTNCHVNRPDNCAKVTENGTELMSHKCSERRISMIIQRSLSATAM